MQLCKICLSTQEYAPQKVLAYAYTMHDLPGQPMGPKTIITEGLKSLQAVSFEQVCASLSQIHGQS